MLLQFLLVLPIFLFSELIPWSTSQESCPANVITNLHQKNCTDRATGDTSYFLSRNLCVPRCIQYDDDVNTDNNYACQRDEECVAGFSCEKRCQANAKQTPCQVDTDCGTRGKCNKFCVPPSANDTASCMAYHSNLPVWSSTYWTALFKPDCDDNNEWIAKQCKGGNSGRCLCFSANGERLFGQAEYAKAANMTCACSRRKNDLESNGRASVTLHCDSMGNYESLQCDIEKKLCWCAEPLTGEPTAPFVPEVAKTKLPCYVTANVGSQYLRQCESKKFASLMIMQKLKAHGVQYVQTDTLLCDADGSYGAYSIASGIVYCTWRDNSKIGTWQSNVAANQVPITCNCARDYKMYNHTKDCDGNGNYATLQHYTDIEGNVRYFCVDDDGFAKSEVFDNMNTDCSTFY